MNDKFDDIILRLQAQQPTLDNADELTDAIMAALPDQQPAPSSVDSPAPRILYLFRNISSAAAVFLIALFLWQYNEEPNVIPHVSSAYEPVLSHELPFACECSSFNECASQYLAQRAQTNSLKNKIRKHYENN